MCGIAGLARVDGGPVRREVLDAMTAVLAHRGPDGDGVHLDGAVGLGHRRLSIIDLATGGQPMGNEDGTVWLVFNGELYNYRELRAELALRGCRFRTTSDTEVLLRAYERDGVGCLPRLRGMFAFALWDRGRRRLLLARDRVGIKPLVYAWDGRRLAFGSEIKAVLQDPSVGRGLDWQALGAYLAFRYVPAPRTIFAGVRKLPPASYLLLDLVAGTAEVSRYWELRPAPDEARGEAEWLEGLRWHLADAVRSHMVSDVPVGAFLSGGLDSSTVVALMARAGSSRVRTFSIGFGEADFDELAYARLVARRHDTEHYEFVVKPDAVEVLPQLAWQFDEPFADASALPTYYLARITRDHVTVALSGDGGDEGFAGYRRYREAAAAHRWLDRGPGRVARETLAAALAASAWRGRRRAYLEWLASDPIERYYRLVTSPRLGALLGLLSPEVRRHLAVGNEAVRFRRLAASAPVPDYVAALQRLDLLTYLPDDILTKVDRTSMLVSLEARVPLLDHRLLEFLATMPTRFKLRRGEGKWILRRAIAEELPAEVLTRGKMGFGVPLGAWFRGELEEYLRAVVLGRRARERGIFDPDAVGALVEEHRTGRRDASSDLWTLLCFEQWAETWLDR